MSTDADPSGPPPSHPATAPAVSAMPAMPAMPAESAMVLQARLVRAAIWAVGVLVTVLALLGGAGSFGTVHALARPWFGEAAWIVPIGVDAGIVALLAWDLILERFDMAWPVLRWVAWAFIAATVYLNIAAAHGDLVASVMHAAMPVLFVTVVEGARHLIRRLVGLANQTRIAAIPRPRWLLAPVATLLLWRRMVLWHVTTYHHGLALEHHRLLAIADLKNRHGRWRWRWHAPPEERLALRLLPAGSYGQLHGTQALPAPRCPHREAAAPPYGRIPHPGGAWPEDDPLLGIARDLVRQARAHGEELSQAALARRLRAHGHTIANGRLRALAHAAALTPHTPPDLDHQNDGGEQA